MYKVAFYLDNSRISIDCSGFMSGNPGIGGTEYLFLITPYLLEQSGEKDLEVTLLLQKEMHLPFGYRYNVVGSIADAIAYCSEQDIHKIVVKFAYEDFYPNIFLTVSDKVDVVLWAHNIIPLHLLNAIAKSPRITNVVNVGREQLDLYRDHRTFLKSTYIYNAVDIKPKEFYLKHSVPYSERKHEVTYLGSLVQAKGFHVLAKVWPQVLKAVPDAHLNVIGSGTVYGNAKLGKYGIAEEKYENLFMPYLVENTGNIHPSVTFHGRIGVEKTEILAQTKVGVPNPSGKTETFCLSAVEMALYGAKIVTKRYVGFLDTVPNTAGSLVDNEDKLADEIIDLLLNDDNEDYDNTYAYYQRLFSYNSVIRKWIDLFEGAVNRESEIVNAEYNFKKVREVNRKIKSVLPFGYFLPTIDFYIILLNKVFKTKFEIMY